MEAMPQAQYVRRRAEQTVGELCETSELEKKSFVLRAVRNEVIGNRTKKFAYVSEGAVEAVAAILRDSIRSGISDATTRELIVQAAAALGSFTCGLDVGAEAVIKSGAVDDLTHLLGKSDARLVAAGARALRLLYQSSRARALKPLARPALKLLINLVAQKDELIAEVSASILARCCDIHNQQDDIQSFGGLDRVLDLLQSSLIAVQQAAMDAIAAMTKTSVELTLKVCGNEGAVEKLLQLSKTGKPHIKLLSCRCLANISTKKTAPESIKRLRSHVLPIVVRLLEQLADKHVPWVLAELVDGDVDLQKVAHDSDAISTIISWLHGISQDAPSDAGAASVGNADDFLKEGLLRAIGTISENLEDARRVLILHNAIPTIVRYLKHSNVDVRAAASLCAKSLSRSQKAIKSSLFDAKIFVPLLSLLSDPAPKVQATACATLCNLVLNYYPMKENILLAGGVSELANLSKSLDSVLRLHSTWAIKNLLYRADRSLKDRVMKELTWPQLMALLNDDEPVVQVQAVTIVRNLVYGKDADIDPVVEYQNGEILNILERILSPTSQASTDMKQHAMYAINNIASGSDRHKELIMQSKVMDWVLHCLRNMESCDLRVAAAWSIINLTWRDSDEAAVKNRVECLKHMGFESQLETMVEDPSLNVKDRVTEALKNFK